MDKLLLSILLVIFLSLGFSQTYSTEKGSVYFIVKADKKNIEAYNHATQVELSIDKNIIKAHLLIKDFNFKNETGKDEFLNQTMEVASFSKATFEGTFKKINPTKYLISGIINMHGMKSEITFPAQIEKTNDYCKAKATFIIQYTDFEINPPKKIAKTLSNEVLVSMDYYLLKTKEAEIEVVEKKVLVIDSLKQKQLENTELDTTSSKTDNGNEGKEPRGNENKNNEIILPKEVE